MQFTRMVLFASSCSSCCCYVSYLLQPTREGENYMLNSRLVFLFLSPIPNNNWNRDSRRKRKVLHDVLSNFLPSRKARKEKKTNTFVAHKPAAKWKKISLFLLNFEAMKMKMERKSFSSFRRRRPRYVGDAKNGKLNKFSFFFLFWGKSFHFDKVDDAHVHLININFHFSLESLSTKDIEI